VDTIVNRVDDERDHTKPDGSSDPFARIERNFRDSLLHCKKRSSTHSIDGESRNNHRSECLPDKRVDKPNSNSRDVFAVISVRLLVSLDSFVGSICKNICTGNNISRMYKDLRS